MLKTYRLYGCNVGERSVRNKEMLCFFDTTLHEASFVLIIVQLCAARKDLDNLQLAQNRAARLALHCQMADINTMHASFSWLRVEESLKTSLLFIRNINVL